MEQPGSVVFSEEGLAIVQARLENLRVELGRIGRSIVGRGRAIAD
jgi:hypothetical protein